ncbi:protein FAM209A-like [Oryx dammah]|uniref:protein FAM209A-like n=1 Tax=Oryx dammah TaxID=59534 RepID=UPI001A9AD6DF|nr:protein FAM209A-like [Oryx dammah]
MITWVPVGAGPSVTSPRAQPYLVLSLQVPAQTSAPGAASSQLTMWCVIWFLFWSTFVAFVFVCVFYVLRDEAEELPAMVPSGRHFQIRQNQPEHAPGWFGSKLFWLLIFLMLLVILKFPRGGDKSNGRTPPGRQGCSSGPPGRKKIQASPSEDSRCSALSQVEKLVKFVSSLRNRKLTAATGDRRQCPNIDIPADTQNNITVYEVWDIGDPNGVDFHFEEEEE